MMAIGNGHDDIVRTLLQGGVDVNPKNVVRNQMMMMMLLLMMRIEMIVDNVIKMIKNII
jgi:hypothetical protein